MNNPLSFDLLSRLSVGNIIKFNLKGSPYTTYALLFKLETKVHEDGTYSISAYTLDYVEGAITTETVDALELVKFGQLNDEIIHFEILTKKDLEPYELDLFNDLIKALSECFSIFNYYLD